MEQWLVSIVPWLVRVVNAICLSVGIDWVKLPETQPPQILPYLPAQSKDDQALTSNYNVSTFFWCVSRAG